jgi:hypothetical protein
MTRLCGLGGRRDLSDGALVGILRLQRDFASLRHGSADDRLMKVNLLATGR